MNLPTDSRPKTPMDTALQERRTFLRATTLFTAVAEPQLRQIAADFVPRRYQARETIFHRERTNKALGILRDERLIAIRDGAVLILNAEGLHGRVLG